ncbi:alkaline phosphatase PhoX [Geochorda subterranea]|uniref:Alkaline phosphatase PhoX n=1 Tax=Geochorda subterranea TaxID=3109564 RepID=A0ABZ1BRX7_9FIRM|nr:alkaline phosphatase PhoX [Limnochorda sp. LNt]WRP15565.1 alkaline phosphatase PhoX [Limnochorda sp. LNt]
MRRHRRCLGVALGLAVSAVLWGIALPAAAQTGPSSSQSPYIVPLAAGVEVRSILTVGDWVNRKPDGMPYRMVGIPDGLGVFDNGDGTFTVLMNHELPGNRGLTRAHGAPGAFVSRWVIRKSDLAVLHGEDLIRQVVTWDPQTASWNLPSRGVAFSRFCSADLPPLTAFYDPVTGLGYWGRLFMNGEEAGAEGRAFAHTLEGISYELPWLGKLSFENVVAHPAAGARTIVVGVDDSPGGQVYVYVGEKRASGNPVEKAGLVGGVLYGVKIEGVTHETDGLQLARGTRFTLQRLGDVSTWTGAQLEEESRRAGVTAFQRPEDGAWDPNRPNDFYFVTTASFNNKSRLWRLRFDDIRRPELGGTVELLLAGDEGP